MSEYMILFAIVPLSCFELTRLFNCKFRNMLCGISIGLVIAPLSFALLQFTCVPVIGGLLGLIGQVINLTHGSIGYFCLVGSGLLEPGVQIAAAQLVMVNLVNGLLFAYGYGIIGYAIDRKLAKKSVARRVVFF